MKFIVDRNTWYRGKGNSDSKLLRTDGTRCCIGFVGQQCGIPDSELLDRPEVATAEPHRLEIEAIWPEWMRTEAEELNECYGINDDETMDDETREAKLKDRFAEQGDELEFVN